eukprot:CAMPEP_0177727808 /NCGR_PEP_ID=MMETSP0484_2-20121128/20524_1 /TAXON_ID=354590 /ORGANISM="Rhodomonas lens, Strain RHODO" /LENGTH=34 /DNA_ID= /DNA_START= /DNA_END= /DNA_ORIENTATION=
MVQQQQQQEAGGYPGASSVPYAIPAGQEGMYNPG